MIYFLISGRLALLGSTTVSRNAVCFPFPCSTPPPFFASLFFFFFSHSLSLFFSFFSLSLSLSLLCADLLVGFDVDVGRVIPPLGCMCFRGSREGHGFLGPIRENPGPCVREDQQSDILIVCCFWPSESIRFDLLVNKRAPGAAWLHHRTQRGEGGFPSPWSTPPPVL